MAFAGASGWFSDSDLCFSLFFYFALCRVLPLSYSFVVLYGTSGCFVCIFCFFDGGCSFLVLFWVLS